MKWHSTKETVKITQNPYYLVKYMDQFGREDIADCVYKNDKFVNLDRMRAANPRGFSPWVRRAIKP